VLKLEAVLHDLCATGQRSYVSVSTVSDSLRELAGTHQCLRSLSSALIGIVHRVCVSRQCIDSYAANVKLENIREARYPQVLVCAGRS
jgi:hypothetical protein